MDHGLPALSLYIHVPWCIRKCPYCDFNSHQVRDEIPEQAYVDQLIKDLQQERERAGDRIIESIFIGGGTPSLFTPDSYEQILKAVNHHFRVKPGAEITLEANPGTFEQVRFEGYRHAGINRVSIGVQSFADQQLKALGRIHSSEEADTAIQSAKTIFDRINIDLMHGLPGQTPAQAISDLKRAIDFNPDQISWYQLTIEPNTEFAVRPPTLPVEEALWQIQEEGSELLEQAGFRQYEISAFARSGGASQHNLNYWQFGDYLGIGAGAHGKLTRIINGELQIERTHKLRQPKGYMNALNTLAGLEPILPADRPFEFMLNALRLTDGVSIETFLSTTGLSLSSIEKPIQRAQQQGLLDKDDHRLKPTREGRLFLNDLLTQFID